VILVTVLDHAERTFNMDVDAAFVGLEGEPQLEVETRKIRAAYLAELEKHLNDMDRIARSFRFDLEVFDSHESVGPILSSLLARREAILRRRIRG
jgi:predicted nucleotidyltransferase